MKVGIVRHELGYVPAIDGLRALAVLAVILYHLVPSALPGGYAGVDIFFVISGFVVTGSLVHKDFQSLTSLAAYFYARRLLRLTPALIVMLLFALLAQQFFIPTAWASELNKRVALSAFFGMSNNVLAFNADNYFSPRASLNPFIHTWSLGIEEQFYLFFPFFMFWRRKDLASHYSDRNSIRLLVVLSAVSFALCGVLTVIGHRFGFYLIVSRFWELGVGMILCLTMDRWTPEVKRWSRNQRLNASIAATTLVAVSYIIPSQSGFPFPLALLPVGGSAGLLMLVTVARNDAITRFFASRWPVRIGQLSYSLYLWHWPVFVLFRWTVGLDNAFLMASAFSLAVGLGAASYYLVERPTRTSRRLRAIPRVAIIQMQLGVLLVSACLAFAMCASRVRLTLSVTGNVRDWYPDADLADLRTTDNCNVNQDIKSFAGGSEVSWRPVACKTGFNRHHVYAIGDSHNWAYAPNYKRLAADTGLTVVMFFRSSCGYLRLRVLNGEDSQCPSFVKAVTARVTARSQPGDVIFLPSLRLSRFRSSAVDEDGEALPIEPPRSRSAKDHENRLAQAQQTLELLTSGGATVVFAAPTPLFRSPAYRCSDWFNAMNPICSNGLGITRAELRSVREPVMDDLRNLTRWNNSVQIWDPFPILCPAQECMAYRSGHPLFFDVDHISGYGDALVYEDFKAAMLNASRHMNKRRFQTIQSAVPMAIPNLETGDPRI